MRGLRGLRAARKEDGAAKDGRDGDTGRRVEGLRAARKEDGGRPRMAATWGHWKEG